MDDALSVILASAACLPASVSARLPWRPLNMANHFSCQVEVVVVAAAAAVAGSIAVHLSRGRMFNIFGIFR